MSEPVIGLVVPLAGRSVPRKPLTQENWMGKRRAASGAEALANNPLNTVVEHKGRPVWSMRFPLPKRKKNKPPFSCQEFVMRELLATDQEMAAHLAEENAKDDDTDKKRGERYVTQAIRMSLVEIDGEKVNHLILPLTQIDGWSLATMAFLRLAFEHMNGGSDDEVEDFFKAATEVSGLVMVPDDDQDQVTSDA